MNFISRNYVRVIPLLIASIAWLIGYIYVYKLVEFGLCSVSNYNCSPLMDNFGFPSQEFSKWFLPTAIMAFFFPITFLRRWIVFLVPYLLVTAYVVNTESPDSLVGKENVALFFDIVLFAITIAWLLIHLFMERRKTKTKSTL